MNTPTTCAPLIPRACYGLVSRGNTCRDREKYDDYRNCRKQ